MQAALPTTWCGPPRAEDDLAHEVSNGSHKYHGIYAVPSDGLDRFELLAGSLQTDALQASALLERLYGRALRFDMGTECGPQYLDMSPVRLTASSADLARVAAAPSPQYFELIEDELRTLGFDVDPQFADPDASTTAKNFVVWVDGPGPQATCGQANYYDDPTRAPHNLNNFGGKIALIFRRGERFCNSNTVRHEIAHNLGALQPGAPNAFDGAHCDDAYEDTMCYPIAPLRASGEHQALFFDYGNDDYWDPAGGALSGWAVNLSDFICPTADCNVPEPPAEEPAPAPEEVPLLPPVDGGGESDGLPGPVDEDDDGDGLLRPVDECPSTPGTSCGESADSTRPAESVARAKVRRRKVAPKRWMVRVQVRGRGRAKIHVSCRGRTVRRRVVRVPATRRFRVRCAKRPRVRVRALAPEERR